MNHCDICNTPLSGLSSGNLIKNSKFKKAVKKGFNPFDGGITFDTGMGLGDLGAAFGMSSKDQYNKWYRQALTDTTDWMLCSKCYQSASRYL